MEALEIIAPYRHGRSGTVYLNQFLQRLLRSEEKVKRFGYKGFVNGDKVLQTANKYYDPYDHRESRTVKGIYVPNGALGYVYTSLRRQEKLQVKFPPEWIHRSFYIRGSKIEENLEMGYAITVHKAQGSQFDYVICIFPADASEFMSRELVYTVLTRARKKLYLLLQKDAQVLQDRLWAGYAERLWRNSALFRTAKGLPPAQLHRYRPQHLVEEALPDLFVRSREEAEIARALARHGIPFYYERPLLSRDGKTFRIPDFTFSVNRTEYYWEHRGLMDNPQYARAWERKERWYAENGYSDRLLVTPCEGMNLAESIRHILRDRLGLVGA